jgi:hypothetical protein
MGRVRIRKPNINKDVENCESYEMVFDSNDNTIKDAFRGVVTKNIPVFTMDEIIFSHNLGYVPCFKIYYDNNNGVYHDASSANIDYAGPDYDFFFVYADDTNIYGTFPLPIYNSGIYNIKYFVFKNRGS